MKLLTISSSAAILFAVPATAMEFDFQGAELSLTGTYGWKPAYTFQTGMLGSSTEFGLGSGAFLQIDGSVEGFRDDFGFNVIGASVGKHVGFEVAPGTNIGAFGALDMLKASMAPTDRSHYMVGLEVAGQVGAVSYDGYGGYLNDFGITNEYHVAASASYDFTEDWSAGIGGHYADTGFGGTMWQASAKLRYQFMDDFGVEAKYTYSDRTFSGVDQTVNLTVTKLIGGGTTFESRDYMTRNAGISF